MLIPGPPGRRAVGVRWQPTVGRILSHGRLCCRVHGNEKGPAAGGALSCV